MATKATAKRATKPMAGLKKDGNIERFLALSDAEKAAEVSRYERGVPEAELTELTLAERKRWEASTAATRKARAADRRSPGRTAAGSGARNVLVSI